MKKSLLPIILFVSLFCSCIQSVDPVFPDTEETQETEKTDSDNSQEEETSPENGFSIFPEDMNNGEEQIIIY